MDLFRKSFLFVVGVVTLTFEEATKVIEKAAKTVEEQRERFETEFSRPQA